MLQEEGPLSLVCVFVSASPGLPGARELNPRSTYPPARAITSLSLASWAAGTLGGTAGSVPGFPAHWPRASHAPTASWVSWLSSQSAV